MRGNIAIDVELGSREIVWLEIVHQAGRHQQALSQYSDYLATG